MPDQLTASLLHAYLPGLARLPPLPAVGRLQHALHSWRQLTSDPWILETVQGYRLELTGTPQQAHEPLPRGVTAEQKELLRNECQVMQEKGAIQPVHEREDQFVSSVFVIPKKDGRQRPVIDLRQLNDYLTYRHFKMEGLHSVCDLLRPGDFLTKVDLKDAYYAVPIAQDQLHLLRFRMDRQLFEFTCLPFGLSSAPRVFTKLLKPVVATLRRMGIRLVIYIDDMLIMARSREESQAHTHTVLDLLLRLGFAINWAKCCLGPRTQLEFLGVLVNSVTMEFALPEEKVRSIQRQCRELLRESSTTVRALASLIGKMNATVAAVLPAPLYYRRLQHLKNRALWSSTGRRVYSQTVTLDVDAQRDLEWWTHQLASWNGRPVTATSPDLVIQSDASNEGWGAQCSGIRTGGRWLSQERALHINAKELLAAFLALKCFAVNQRRATVCLQMDNRAAVAYVNRRGGTASRQLLSIARQLWEWCLERRLTAQAEHLPGALNTTADFESRHFQDSSDWQLNPRVFHQIQRVFRRSNCDLFASRTNSQLQHYVSWRPDPEAGGTDAFTQNWEELKAYAFPPFCLIGRCLAKLERQRVRSLVLITPLWPAQPWYPRLLHLAIDYPRILPSSPDLLIGPQQEQHPLLAEARLPLVVWLLSGIPSRAKAFHQRWSTCCWHHGEEARSGHTRLHSDFGLIGVLNGRCLHSRPL